MNSLPFHEIEDTADSLDGDLSRYSLPVIFAPETRTGAVRVRRASKRQVNRLKSLLPGGVPRYVRCYASPGMIPGGLHTCYVGRFPKPPHSIGFSSGGIGVVWRTMSTPQFVEKFYPFSTLNFSESEKHIDVDRWGFPPQMGRKNHLGRRIPFAALPEDCRKLVLADYRELWRL